MEILFNNDGTPLIMYGSQMFADTVGTSGSAVKSKNILAPFDQWRRNYTYIDDNKVVGWGLDNRFPQHALKTVAETTVLNTGLHFLRNLTIGQGIYPCTVSGYDDQGNEVLKPVDDTNLTRFLQGRMARRYMEKMLRDYLKVGNGAVQFIPGVDGKSINGLNPLNPLFYRLTEPDGNAYQSCLISGYWPANPGKDQYDILPCLNEYDPDMQADVMKFTGALKKGFVYVVRDSWSNEDIYGEPIWWPAFVSGWIDIAHLVPQFLKKAYKNQITWKWHVQIPYSYWDKKFPEKEFSDTKARQLAINTYMDTIERNLCGPENAEKPLMTNYAINEANGKIEEEWKINALDNKYKDGENLVTSAAANSEILFALMVNPNVFGAGMPGGSYAGNQGGSNIREAFLVNIANAWIDRQNLLDPLELYIKMNGLPDCELRFRNTILTTLDTGVGTKKTLS